MCFFKENVAINRGLRDIPMVLTSFVWCLGTWGLNLTPHSAYPKKKKAVNQKQVHSAIELWFKWQE